MMDGACVPVGAACPLAAFSPAREAAGHGRFAVLEDGGQRVSDRLGSDLRAPGIEKLIRADHKAACSHG
jgi:hypothetical protein